MMKRPAEWLFEEGDPLPLRAIQVYFSALVIWQLAWLTGSFSQWLGTPGWILTDCLKGQGPLVTNAAAWTVLVLTILAAACMGAGFYARTSAFFTWAGLTLLIKTYEPASGGGDIVSTYAVFLLIFAQTDKRWVPLWPQKLILLTLSTFYAGAVLHKIGDSCWRDGTATFFALQYESFRFWPRPQMIMFPQLGPALTYSTLVIESLLALLPLFLRWKFLILLLGVGLHVGLSYVLFIPHFGTAMIGLYFGALNADEIRKAWRFAIARCR
jgi:hypothetical protein